MSFAPSRSKKLTLVGGFLLGRVPVRHHNQEVYDQTSEKVRMQEVAYYADDGDSPESINCHIYYDPKN